MTNRSLKSTTAILAAMSLLQPLPSLAQSSPNATASTEAVPEEAEARAPTDAEGQDQAEEAAEATDAGVEAQPEVVVPEETEAQDAADAGAQDQTGDATQGDRPCRASMTRSRSRKNVSIAHNTPPAATRGAPIAQSASNR